MVSALVDDLKLINIDAATGDEEYDARLTAGINCLISGAEAERGEEVARMINRVYKESAPADTLALNQVRAFRQDRIVAWQNDFDQLPKPRPIQGIIDKTVRKPSAFTSVRAMFPRTSDIASTFETYLAFSRVSEAEEFFSRIKMRRFIADSFTSPASDASEPENGLEKPQKVDSVQPETASSEPSAQATQTEETSSTSDAPVKADPDSDSTIGGARTARRLFW
jgi:1-phosphatidylinositol-3-phosphate 5-kinase